MCVDALEEVAPRPEEVAEASTSQKVVDGTCGWQVSSEILTTRLIRGTTKA